MSILFRVILSMLVAVGRRLLGRRLRPSYTLKQEIQVEAFERLSGYFAGKSFAELRAMEQHMAPPVSDARAVTREVVNVPPTEMYAEWLRPAATPEPHRALLWCHGGGYILGSVDAERDLLERLTLACESATFAFNYRLPPESPCPAALDDAVAAYHVVRARGYPPESIVLGGISAGGGLALATLMALRDAGEPLPRAAVLLSAWVDLDSEALNTGRTGFLELSRRSAEVYRGALDRRDPRVSPLHADLTGLPPASLHFGGAEPFAPENRELVRAWRATGVEVESVEWEDMPHGFHAFPPHIFPQAEASLEAVGRFVRDATSHPLGEEEEVALPKAAVP